MPSPSIYNAMCLMEGLPVVLVQLIFQALDLPSFLRLGRSSRHFYQIADSEPSWKEVDPRCYSSSFMIVIPQFRRRMVILDSSHTSAFLRSSLIQRHANISWDVCHDSFDWQYLNFVAHHSATKWPDKWVPELDANFTMEFIYDMESEINVLSENIPYLNTLVIGDGLTSKSMERIFKAHMKKNSLTTLVLTINSGCVKHVSQIVEDSAFNCLVSISSLTKLSLSSAYYTKGQLSFLSKLVALESLRLENQHHSPPVFDKADLLTIGQCSSLTDLFIEEGMRTFTPQFTIQFLQQGNLKKQLISLTFSRFNFRSGPWTEDYLLQAFNGYNNLQTFNLIATRNHRLLKALLRVLSNSRFDGIGTDELSSFSQNVSFDSFLATRAVFLPSLTKLFFYTVIPRELPPVSDWEHLLKYHSRMNLCIKFHLDLEGHSSEEIHSTFLQLSLQYPSQLGFLQTLADPPNSNLRRTCCITNPPWSNMIKSLIKLKWIENEQADHVGAALHELNYSRHMNSNDS